MGTGQPGIPGQKKLPLPLRLETFPEDPARGQPGPPSCRTSQAPSSAPQRDLNTCPLLLSLQKKQEHKDEREHLSPLRSSRGTGRRDACLQRCRERTV